jgi:hypothetical protein
MDSLFGISANLGFVIAAAVAALLAIYGYHWIHRVNRVLAWPLIVLMAVLTVAAFTNAALPPDAFTPGDFQLAPFMTAFVIIAGFQLGWAVYVSDYSPLPARDRRRALHVPVDLSPQRAERRLGVRPRRRDVRRGPRRTPPRWPLSMRPATACSTASARS